MTENLPVYPCIDQLRRLYIYIAEQTCVKNILFFGLIFKFIVRGLFYISSREYMNEYEYTLFFCYMVHGCHTVYSHLNPSALYKSEVFTVKSVIHTTVTLLDFSSHAARHHAYLRCMKFSYNQASCVNVRDVEALSSVIGWEERMKEKD